jgi:hypothetical protein
VRVVGFESAGKLSVDNSLSGGRTNYSEVTIVSLSSFAESFQLHMAQTVLMQQIFQRPSE